MRVLAETGSMGPTREALSMNNDSLKLNTTPNPEPAFRSLLVPRSLWHSTRSRAGKVRPVLLMLALGIPIPLVLIVFLLRGCSM